MATVAAMFKKPKDGSALARQEAMANQRRALAQMSRAGAETDAAGQRSGSKRGRSLLSFLGADGAGGLQAA
jgi:hypothetical protein